MGTSLVGQRASAYLSLLGSLQVIEGRGARRPGGLPAENCS